VAHKRHRQLSKRQPVIAAIREEFADVRRCATRNDSMRKLAPRSKALPIDSPIGVSEADGIQVTRLIHDFYAADPRRGFYGGGAIDARFDFYPAGLRSGAFQTMCPTGVSNTRRRLGSTLRAP
jgi:hypothetical protein